ncbi:MAG: MarR family winged helix-turn-helix transcriptional regulator [Specibacter sp.]
MKPSRNHAELLAAMREFTMESDRYVDRAAAVNGLHRTDLNALGFLFNPGVDAAAPTPGKLGQALNLSSPAVTALVDRLEHSGHVTRHRGQVDRRQVELSMTDAARVVGRELFSPLAAELGAALEKYSPEELSFVERFLHEMTDATTAAKERLHVPTPSDGSE